MISHDLNIDFTAQQCPIFASGRIEVVLEGRSSKIIRQNLTMKLVVLVATASLIVAFIGQTHALSFQGQEELRTNTIMIEERTRIDNDDPNSFETKSSNGLSNQREEMRKMRLYILGALVEQLVAWFFQDIIPKEVMQRTKRSLNVPGDYL